jgi:predicted aspartyl protease
MLSRRDLALGLGAAFAAGPALAQVADPLPEEGATTSLRARRDRDTRMTIEVMIGPAGPFQFVVDTGADTSVIASEIAAGMGLAAGRNVMIHGITGVELVGTVKAPPLKLGPLTLSTRDLPVLPRERLGGDGLLGMDVLKNNRLVLDFRQKRMEIRAASGRSLARLDPRFIAVPAEDSFGRLTVINARANNVSATAFVDSGASLSIVNPALARAMKADRRWESTAPLVELTGVTDHVLTGEGRMINRLRVGTLSFNHIPVVVADLHLFRRWNLQNQPAILLGVDVLRMFARVELDYGRRRMLFRAGMPTVYQV